MELKTANNGPIYRLGALGFIKKVSIIVTFLVLLPFVGIKKGFGEESWMTVKGEKLSFKLPSRPVGSKESHSQAMNFISSYETLNFLHISNALDVCPKFSTLIQRIYNTIIEKNNLSDFIENGPTIKLGIKCFEDKNPTKESPNYPHMTGNNYVVLQASMANYLKSESEIAFVIAHEISHILLGHIELILDLEKSLKNVHQQSTLRRNKNIEVLSKTEPEADIYGAILMFNAGFTPYSAYYAILRAYEYNSGPVGMLLLTNDALFDFFDEGHGSPRKRRIPIEQYFQSSNVINNYKPFPTAEMNEAKKEFQSHHKN